MIGGNISVLKLQNKELLINQEKIYLTYSKLQKKETF